MRKALILLSIALVSVQLLGVAYMDTMLSTAPERGDVIPSSRSDSTSRVILLPIFFIIAINLYVFLFRYRTSMKLFKAYFYGAAILAWVLLTFTLLAFYLQVTSDAFYIAVFIAPIALLKTRLKIIALNLLAVALSSVAGASLAAILNLEALVIATGMLSLLDYYFVLKENKIVRLAEKFREAEIPIGLTIGKGGMALGFGDLIFSTAIVVATFIEASFFPALLMALFITTSMFLYLNYFLKKDQALPALPPIFGGALAGLVVTSLL